MLSKLFFLVLCVFVIHCEDSIRVKRTKYSYPSRFYRIPPSPHHIKGAFSYTPPPGYMNDEDAPYKHNKVSRKPPNDGLGDEDINNLMKHLTKKDLDKIVEFASEKERYSDKYVSRYRDDSSERLGYDRPTYRRPERLTGLSSDDERFLLNGPFVRDGEKNKLSYNNEQSYIKPTQPTYSDSDINPNLNFVNAASQSKAIFSAPPEDYNSKVVYRNPEEYSQPEIYKAKVLYSQGDSIPSNVVSTNPNNLIFSNPQVTYQEEPFQRNNIQNIPNTIYSNYQAIYGNSQESSHHNGNRNPFYTNQAHNQNNFDTNASLDTEESKLRYVAYVTVPPPNTGAVYTNSATMEEEQLPKPLNLREDEYEASNTDNVPRVVDSDSYEVQSFKDLPLMNEYQNSKLHTVSSYNVPHYTVTQTKTKGQLSYGAPSTQKKAPVIEKAPPGYDGKDMSDAHLKAVKIWTHRSRGTAYTLHDDGSLSLEKPKIRTSYGYA